MKFTTTTTTAATTIITTTVVAMAGVAAAAKDNTTFAVLQFTNKGLVTTRADPIVNPGVPSGHVHNVLGGSNFGFSSTGEDLLRSNCSTALVKGDYSNYWYPTLYFHDTAKNDFQYVDVYYTNVYYFFEASNDDIKAFPAGLQILAGDTMSRTVPAAGGGDQLDPSKGPVNNIQFTCPRLSYNPPSYPVGSDGSKFGMVDPHNQGAGVGFPDVTCDGLYSPLRMDIHFPSCYNPAAGLTNYKENTRFPTDAGNGKRDCPEGWIHVPHLFFEVYFDTQPYKGRWTENQGTQPFVLSNGDVTGYGAHADFMAGWDEDVLQHIIDTCNTGTSGMDQCPDLDYGLNSGDCTIAPLVNEQVTGNLTKLPGDNPLSGFSYGAAPAMPAGVTAATPTATPAATSAHSSGTRGNSAATVRGYTPASCYQDNVGRVFTGDLLPNLGPMSNDKCVSNCCYCGNDLAGSTKLAESQCSMACDGNSKEVCGGSWAINANSKAGSVTLRPERVRRRRS
ncbi:COOH terminal WSC domain-containing protein [Trichoderma velutinum]